MSRDDMVLRHRFYPRAWSAPRYVSMDQLDVVMANANKHFSTNPERQLGGPVLPLKGRK